MKTFEIEFELPNHGITGKVWLKSIHLEKALQTFKDNFEGCIVVSINKIN